MVVTLNDGTVLDSGLCMYPSGHARNTSADLQSILNHKFGLLGSLSTDGDVWGLVSRFNGIDSLDASGLLGLYDFEVAVRSSVD